MKKMVILFLLAILSVHTTVFAHFGMVIPDRSIATDSNRNIHFAISFSHPFEQIGMDMERPDFDVYYKGNKESLINKLKPAKIMNSDAWTLDYRPTRPGVYQFVASPTPYWEPSEDCFIVHYTKTIVAAFGMEDGWGKKLGLETEIVPMSRPFGFYKGYTFTGRVIYKGKPVPFAEVEVEYYNRDGKYSAPDDLFVTYVLTADNNGVFHFSCPLAGWWGFAALTTADYKLKGPDNKEKPVEIGAVLWLQVTDWQKQKGR